MKKNILVTGSRKSDFTLADKTIAFSENVRCVQELFNFSKKKYKSPFKYWFEYMPVGLQPFQNNLIKYLNSFHSLASLNDLFRYKKQSSARRYITPLKTTTPNSIKEVYIEI